MPINLAGPNGGQMSMSTPTDNVNMGFQQAQAIGPMMGTAQDAMGPMSLSPANQLPGPQGFNPAQQMQALMGGMGGVQQQPDYNPQFPGPTPHQPQQMAQAPMGGTNFLNLVAGQRQGGGGLG